MTCVNFNVKEVVQVLNITNEDDITSDIFNKRKPVVMRGLDIGTCVKNWTPDYLAEKMGNINVKVHVTTNPQMDFIKKNFSYKTLPFDEFIGRASEEVHQNYFFSQDEKYYLRSLGDDPRKEVAKIDSQFSQLSPDVRIPAGIFTKDQFFSSVLRIGSNGLQLWTHYDIMDNILMQINGEKRVVLFGPSDSLNLYLNGDKSEVIDIDNPDLTKYPRFRDAVRYETVLRPGDVLFIPALWFHNTLAYGYSVGVNVFWKHLENQFYDGKDVYGNKDLVPAAQAINLVEKSIKLLESLPGDYKDFYGRRLITQIQNKVLLN
ncbi:hypothetical protein CHUAL_004423 [Chamberlinius hualienensis]